MTVPPAYQEQLKKAEQEYLTSITARPDQWTSHYNLGNYQLGRGENKEAVASFEKALEALLAKYPGYRDAEMLYGELTKTERKP